MQLVVDREVDWVDLLLLNVEVSEVSSLRSVVSEDSSTLFALWRDFSDRRQDRKRRRVESLELLLWQLEVGWKRRELIERLWLSHRKLKVDRKW